MLNVAQRHAAGIQRDDHVIEAAEPAGTLRYQAWGERAGTVTRNVQLDRPGRGVHRFRARPVAGVGQLPTGRIALGIAEVIGQLGLQAAFESEFDQTRDQAAVAGDLDLAGIDLGQQLIDHARGLQRLGHLRGRTRLSQLRQLLTVVVLLIV